MRSLIRRDGLNRGENGLEVYVMCEISSNVVLAREFADGFAIGWTDLTLLTQGADRDSEIVAHVCDERSDAVKPMIVDVLESAHDSGRRIGVCGHTPSYYPEFAEFPAKRGIDSI